MRRLITKFVAAALVGLMLAAVPAPVLAQQTVVAVRSVDSVAGFAGAVNGTGATPCAIIKYVGTTAGLPDVAVAAGGDMTLRIAGAVDATTGRSNAGASPNSGVWDLSTPHASVDTFGELVSLMNTVGSNWRMVLVGCLASDLTDNTIDTLTTTDASIPGGVVLYKDAVVASASGVFSAQIALLPEDAATNIRFFLSGGPVGATTGSTKVNPNPLQYHQFFVQHIREKITSTGTVALFEVLGVKRTYDSTGKVSETVRTLYATTGGATTVEKEVNFHNGPIPTAKGELVIVRVRTTTDLTVQSIDGSGYAVFNR